MSKNKNNYDESEQLSISKLAENYNNDSLNRCDNIIIPTIEIFSKKIITNNMNKRKTSSQNFAKNTPISENIELIKEIKDNKDNFPFSNSKELDKDIIDKKIELKYNNPVQENNISRKKFHSVKDLPNVENSNELVSNVLIQKQKEDIINEEYLGEKLNIIVSHENNDFLKNENILYNRKESDIDINNIVTNNKYSSIIDNKGKIF